MAMPSARGKPLKHAQAAKTCSRSVRSTESSLALPQSTASALRMSLSHTSERADSCLWRKGGRPGALHAEYTPRARQRVRCYFQAHAPPPITSSSGPPRPNRPHTATPRRGLRDAHTGCVRTARGRRGRRASGAHRHGRDAARCTFPPRPGFHRSWRAWRHISGGGSDRRQCQWVMRAPSPHQTESQP